MRHDVDGVVSAYQVWAPTDNVSKTAKALNGLLVGQSFGNLDQMRQAINQAIQHSILVCHL